MKNFFAAIIILLIFSAQVEATDLKIYRDADRFISLSNEPFTLQIVGSNLIDGEYQKGVAIFDGRLYFHFDADIQNKTFEEIEASASRFGGRDFENTVPVYVFEGATKIYPIVGDDCEFYLLMTETGGGGSSKVIGERVGEWIKYFDTQDMQKNNRLGWDFYLENFYTEDDTIIFVYRQDTTNKICELRYKWDEVEYWFNEEIIYR